MTGYDGVHLVGRFVSGFFDLMVVPLAFLIGRRLYNSRVGLLAAAFYTFSVLALQQSHFYTVDTFGAFFAALTFYFAVRVAQGADPARRSGWGSYLGLGLALGMALATRINLAPMAAIAILAAGIRAWDEFSDAAGSGRRQGRVRVDEQYAAGCPLPADPDGCRRGRHVPRLPAVLVCGQQPDELLAQRRLPRFDADDQLHH